MGRKRKTDEEPTSNPPSTESSAVAVAELPSQNGVHEANGDGKNRPCKSLSVSAGNGVYIEASIWPKELTHDNRTFTVFSVTVRKSYTKDGGGYGNTQFFRGSELHLVTYVLEAANRWILDQRVEQDPPF